MTQRERDATFPEPANEPAGSPRRGRITVLAGVNGAGKSSVLGATIQQAGGRYFNPDEEARTLLAAEPRLPPADANLRAWEVGRRGLERAIIEQADYTFETTLGGRTIADLLARALDANLEVVLRYVGLDSPERHIARVRARVARGGHDIPAATIRARYTSSREHLIALLPRLSDLVVYDNSEERDPVRGQAPAPTLVLGMADGRIWFMAPKERIATWARPVVAAAILSHMNRAKRDPQP